LSDAIQNQLEGGPVPDGRFDVVVYPKELDAAELAFGRLGWEIVGRPSGAGGTGVVFRVPAGEIRLELVTHGAARALVDTLGYDVIAGLRLEVPDADAAWQAANHAGMRLDPVSAERPSEEAWGRLVRAYCAGGLRIDFVQPPGA
jgi:hypothetical protein